MPSKHSIATFWENAVQVMYDETTFISELKKKLKKLGITRKSRILDASAGTGFPGIALLRSGYNIDFNDLSKEMLSQLKTKLRKEDHVKISAIDWTRLSQLRQRYDLILCRGNSLIYARSWNKPNSKKSRHAILQSLQGIKEVLNSKGMIWVDINSKDEFKKKGIVTERFQKKIRNKTVTMTWQIKHIQKKHLRIVRGEIISGDSIFKQDFHSYLLRPQDLKSMLGVAGYTDIKAQKMKNEFYSIFTAKPD